ncbi:MAG: protein-L-isoaspartate O-methyltransferase [Candidatus Staskawiczbacteria bacterium RIFOXYC1_FULL_37_43]|nr:MAG: protein-L-isoaspartate O-methyltransferase [Candidatus Staskawiczbacteria bacterium RIFCSPHIGHO2_01_FULL_37_17]OGZ71277.1 MAG: protein-L-isoaspartate O-methyltransferase [Candidatus Staskawiczbacteria bacterium RIFCSPLOWO2_01_FULL_37_19]OGZ75583.1 MAG: protein-L-isoaspartate O-methyltransferase [Candidatus Staskawiczbacteria bacterium RIFOXYA1_FULL_37_15]OGZ77700.1 MAG: protein-L-isoaspartate O-methyltransferase [Candidatus Staskawiczbacteria bacterium RIFOXYA12_FULL_37_10]OGZ79859.1 MA
MEHITKRLIDELVEGGWLKTPEIINAFKKIKRKDFIPEDAKSASWRMAELNQALPIGFGQTISQPLTVAFMLEILQPKRGDKILDVGAGSGWTSALLAEIAGKKGGVIAIEIIPELFEFGKNNTGKYGFVKKGTVEFILGNGAKGYEKEAPYDKILVSASAKRPPEILKKQLKINGRLVCPVENSIWLFIKKSKNEFEQKEYKGFVFVPLV